MTWSYFIPQELRHLCILINFHIINFISLERDTKPSIFRGRVNFPRVTKSGTELELEPKPWVSRHTARGIPWACEFAKESREELRGRWGMYIWGRNS